MKHQIKIKIKILFFCIIVILFSSNGKAQPQRIISLAPSITESLFDLDVGSSLIGVTSSCNHPPQAKSKVIVSNLTSINIEKVFSLKPDLVISIKNLHKIAVLNKLKDLGLNLVIFEEMNNFSEINRNFLQLGEIVGKKEKAEAIIKKTSSEVEKIKKKVKTHRPVSIFWEIGANPLFTVGRNSFVNDLIEFTGGYNIFSDFNISYPQVSREEVLKRNPEVIIIVTMGTIGEKEKAFWSKFKDLEAVKSGKIFIVDSDKVCRPTPYNFLKGLKEITRYINPQLFTTE